MNATYTYDALSRLAGVTGAAGANRTQSFSYDGWGNLYAKTGGGLNFTSGVDAATNRLTVACHDANGNLLGVGGCATYSYDVLNRLSRVAVSSSGATDGSGHTDLSAEYYSYTADNKRVTTWRPNGNSQQVFYIYGAKGDMAGLCTVQVLGQALVCEGPRELRLAGRVFQRNNQFVVSDRLGSVVANAFVSVAGSLPAYPPYGESGGLATGVYPGNSGFATYFEDQTTGLDYADQRYYTSTYGRFMTADPYRASAGPEDPGSWNRYSYVKNDPVNSWDPMGLAACPPGSNCVEVTADAVLVSYYYSGLLDTGYGGKRPFWIESGSKKQYLRDVQCQQPDHPGLGDDVLANNVAEAKAQADRIVADISALPNVEGSDPGSEFFARLGLWLYEKFRKDGDWDPKDNESITGGNLDNINKLRDWGNFNFGAVLQSLGLSLYETQNAAGLYQKFGIGKYSEGIPLIQWPFGDSGTDARTVQQGWTFGRLACQ